jgi:hypothetical protein
MIQSNNPSYATIDVLLVTREVCALWFSNFKSMSLEEEELLRQLSDAENLALRDRLFGLAAVLRCSE